MLNTTLTTLISTYQDKGAQMHTHLPNMQMHIADFVSDRQRRCMPAELGGIWQDEKSQRDNTPSCVCHPSPCMHWMPCKRAHYAEPHHNLSTAAHSNQPCKTGCHPSRLHAEHCQGCNRPQDTSSNHSPPASSLVLVRRHCQKTGCNGSQSTSPAPQIADLALHAICS